MAIVETPTQNNSSNDGDIVPSEANAEPTSGHNEKYCKGERICKTVSMYFVYTALVSVSIQ